MNSNKSVASRFFAHDITQIVLAALLIASISIAPVIVSTFKTGYVGKQIGTVPLAAYSMVNSFFMQCVVVLVYLMGGLASTISRLKATKKHAEIGQQINSAMVSVIAWSLILTPTLYFLRIPAFDLYGIPEEVRELATPYYTAYLAIIPALSLNSIVGGLLLGLKKVSAKAIPTVIFAATDIIAAYIIVIVFKNHDLVVLSIAATALRAVVVLVMLGFIYISPKRRRKYNLISWNVTKDSMKVFASAQGLMLGRGLILIIHYIASPVIASRLGVIQYGTYSIIYGLFFFPIVFGDAVGSSSNIFGSRMLGRHEYKKYRVLASVVPLASVFIAIITGSVFWAFEDPIINSFSNDPLVIRSLHENWYMLLILAGVSPFVGLFEGLAMSRHKFKLLFFSMVGAVFVSYLPLSLTNLFVWRRVDMILISIVALELTRFVPCIFGVYWSLIDLGKRKPPVDSANNGYSPLNINGDEEAILRATDSNAFVRSEDEGDVYLASDSDITVPNDPQSTILPPASAIIDPLEELDDYMSS